MATDLQPIEKRADAGLDSGLAPNITLDDIWVGAAQFDVVSPISTVIRTSGGIGKVNVPALTLAKQGDIVAEHDAIPDPAADWIFANVVLDSWKIVAGAQRATVELMGDSPSYRTGVGIALGRELGLGINEYLTNGSGTAQPAGVATGAGDSTVSGAITWATVMSLLGSVSPAYAMNGTLMINPSDLAALNAASPGASGWLAEMGVPVVLNSDLTGKYLYGDFSAYYVKFDGPTRVQQLDEPYALNGQVAHVAWQLFDGGLASADAVKFAAIP
jgi:HK97 family phage major capsid protein